MKSLAFAVRMLVRQPARALLGILGVAAVGALLFDMLLLSNGLVISFRHLLDRAGFDVRVLSTDAMPLSGPRVPDASRTTSMVAGLAEVESVVPLRMAEAVTSFHDNDERLTLIGARPSERPPWTLVEGQDLSLDRDASAPIVMLVNRTMARTLELSPGRTMRLAGECESDSSALPQVDVRVAGIAEFPFDTGAQMTAAVTLDDLNRICGNTLNDAVDVLLVTSRPAAGPEATAEAIRDLRPDLHVFTNDDIVERFQRTEFSYFRQISAVLMSVTMFFGFLLITVLLTVSVNQRFVEIAALRALGITRARVVMDVLSESVLLVGVGGLLALPLGLALSIWLDGILRSMPEIPSNVRFFVFEQQALVLHLLLLGVTAIAAALYPMWLVARLPITSTLRRETVS